MDMIDLQKSREKIDEIDKKIVELFEDRMKVAKDVAEYKISVDKPVYDKQREIDKLSKLKDRASNEFNRHGVEELFTQIMSMSRKLQYGLVSHKSADEDFKKVPQINVNEKTKVIFFGERGSYTEQAMEEYFGQEVDSFPTNDFRQVMQMIKEGKAEYGVLPIENSSTGGIGDIYDLLIEYNHNIIGEHIIKVNQTLMGLKGAKISDIKTVYSHQQGLMQCSKFFEEHKNIEQKEYKSTSASAKKVLEDNDPTKAAIASIRAAKTYGLEILQEKVNYESKNATRFIIITGQKIYLETANKVSICFELPHESGTLYNMLSHFIYNSLNMTKIESRPIAGKRWEYRFFVDFDGNLNEAGVRNALNGIREEATSLRILGNFHSVG